MELIFGAGILDRHIEGVEGLLADWHEKEADWGQLYLEYESVTPRDALFVEDLAVTMLINSRVAGRAATSVCRRGTTLDMRALARRPRVRGDLPQRKERLASAGAAWRW
jgi:hypothetical protein